MKSPLWLLLQGGIASAILQVRDHDAFDYFAVHLQDTVDPKAVAAGLHANLEGPLGELPNHYTFSCPKHRSTDLETSLQDLKRRRLLRKRGLDTDGTKGDLDGVKWHQKQELKQRLVKRIPPPPVRRKKHPEDEVKLNEQQEADKARMQAIANTLDITDPIFMEQWHLFNFVQKGVDVNVTGVWEQGITGTGVVSAIIDDGLDFTSNDLKPNYYANGSWDFNNPGPDPKPRLSDDRHGTRCAGEIAAARNDICGVGIAYDSKIAGIRILSAPITDEDEALSINYHYQENDIYSCSWGPPDDGQSMEGPGVLIRKAMVNGVQKGRAGKGSVFVFAGGNGAAKEDNCNFDGYTNSIYSITTGAIDRVGDHPYYSEKCSALLLVTPSSGHQDAIHTTDVGFNSCYNGHGGTSAAGPLMAGAAALVLSVRPELTWRDVQYLVINTCIPIHLDDANEWQDTAIGKKFSHTYGYGKLDTYALIELAKTWELVKPQAWYHSPWIAVLHEIPQGDQGLAASFDITPEMLKKANLERLEHVTVTMNVEHTRRGDLSVELKSPTGVISHLSTTRKNDNARSGYIDWTFMSVVHWGESGVGTWTVVLKDTIVNNHQGKFVDWRLNLWGESIDGSQQELHPLPEEHEDDHEVATAIVTTTTVDVGSSATELPAHPSDHPERPTKPKPTDAGTGETTTTSTSTSTAGASTTDGAQATHTVSENFLPGFFPTFGVSKRTQIWIYGSIALMVVFCAGLGAYFLVQKRKRLRNSREDYEFAMINDDDVDEAKQGLTGGRGGRRRRGGELYDAFAGESDEDVFSDDDDEAYQDTPDHDTSGSGSGSPRDKV